MLTSAPGIAFLPARDLERSREFFERLGLRAVEVTPVACVFRAGPVMLRVTQVGKFQPQPFTVFGWEVTEIRAAAGQLAALGIACLRYTGIEQDDAGIWTTPAGDQVAWFEDPDGNVLSVTQFASRLAR